ncbi:MAG: hypothetical protein AAFY64_06365 [Pseudomonadota bacterium]
MKFAALWIAAAVMAAGLLYAVMAMQGKSLRYVVAMVFAAGSALFATVILASPIASYATNQMRFESPDGAADVHMFTFLGVAISGLVLGWLVGWAASTALQRQRPTSRS